MSNSSQAPERGSSWYGLRAAGFGFVLGLLILFIAFVARVGQSQIPPSVLLAPFPEGYGGYGMGYSMPSYQAMPDPARGEKERVFDCVLELAEARAEAGEIESAEEAINLLGDEER